MLFGCVGTAVGTVNTLFTSNMFLPPYSGRVVIFLTMKALYNLLSKLQRLANECWETSGKFVYWNFIVTYSFSELHDSIEIYNPDKERYLDNISEWLLLNIEKKENERDEWNDHGFRDEADYIRYKFG